MRPVPCDATRDTVPPASRDPNPQPRPLVLYNYIQL